MSDEKNVRTIQIRNVTGEWEHAPGRPVTADLGINRTLGDDGKPIRAHWRVTHLRSGMAIPVVLPNEREAVAVARAAQEAADWSFEDPEAVRGWTEEQRCSVAEAVEAASVTARDPYERFRAKMGLRS